MLHDSKAFSGFSVDDLATAKEFYGTTLDIDIQEEPEGLILKIPNSNGVFVYPKENHVPATYTILNFPVNDIDEVVDSLKEKGVRFEQYPEMTDEKGIARGLSTNRGPDIAWFKDPAGNILAVLKNE